MSAPAALTEHKSVPRFLGEIAIKMAISSESKLIKSNAMIITDTCQSIWIRDTYTIIHFLKPKKIDIMR